MSITERSQVVVNPDAQGVKLKFFAELKIESGNKFVELKDDQIRLLEYLREQLNLTFGEIKVERSKFDSLAKMEELIKTSEPDHNFELRLIGHEPNLVHQLYAEIHKIQEDIENIERHLVKTTTKKH